MFVFGALTKGEQGREFTEQFDRQLTIFRDEADGFDETADCLRCFANGTFRIESFDQVRDFLAVHVGKVGMQARLRGRDGIDLRNELPPSVFKRPDLIPDALARHAGLDCFDQARNLPLHFRQIVGEAVPFVVFRCGQPVQLAMELGDKRLVGVGLHELFLEACDDGLFDHVAPDGEQVGTGPLVARGRAAVVMLADLGEPAAAGAALEETGQQVSGAAGTLGSDVRAFRDRAPCPLLSLLDALPEIIVDDPELGDLLHDPFVLWVHAGLALAGTRVLDESLTVPDPSTGIELVVQDAGVSGSPFLVSFPGIPIIQRPAS